MKTTTFLIAFFLFSSLSAQDKIKTTEPEAYLLSLLTRDSTSNTVFYLPESFSYGIKGNFPIHLIAVKSKKRTYILVDGTQRVYIPDPTNPTSQLLRIDSSRFEADNFGSMPFIRKDTLYQYGGYGFWQNRDFITKFSDKSGEWEVQQATSGLQNTYTFNYYDPTFDRYYVLGGKQLNTYKSHTPTVIDSVYVFDWRNNSWSCLGSSPIPDNGNSPNQHTSILSNMGIGLFLAKGGHFLLEPGKNKMYKLRTQVNQTFNDLLSSFQNEILSSQFFSFHLNDTLYLCKYP